MKRQRIRALGNLNDNKILGPLVCVIFRQLDPQSSRLHSNRRVTLRIEASRPPQHFRSNLVFLQRYARVIQRVFSEVPEKFAQRFRGSEAMAFNKFIYLLEALLPAYCDSVRDSHITGM